MSTPPEFTEEELAALEAEMDRISVDDVLLQTIVSLVNLGARKAGLAGPEGPPADLEQTRQAIEGARALLPLIESELGPDGAAIREALSQLQMAYAQLSAGDAREGDHPAGAGDAPASGDPQESGPGPAQSSGRLWVPGQ